MTLTKQQKEIAELVRRMKSGSALTDAEQGRIERYRQDAIAKESQQALIELLARGDVLFEMIRRPYDAEPVQRQLELRANFYKRGLSWRAGGQAAERKAGERELSALVKAGKIVAHRQGSRVTHAKLTDACDWQTRSLCGVPSVRECFATMLLMLDSELQRDFIAANDGKKFIPEHILGGWPIGAVGNDWTEKAFELEEQLRPAIIRGWIAYAVHNVSIYAYALTPAGRAALDQLPQVELPEPDSDAASAFDAAWNTALEKLQSGQRENPACIQLIPYFQDFRTENQRRAEAAQPAALVAAQ